ncbi:putative ABC transporter ATP-binding protein [Bifidobacteriaceae bacterium MCC01971]|nr:putative ABC transporter ATP-binding protein [Bifidobacteriaceae bacterium MCC01971]
MTVAPHSFDADEFHDSAEPAPPAAVLKDIRFSYDRGTSWALDGVSLTVHAGERLCLVGPNGSGKSTLARLIAGLTAPDGGEVTLLEQRVHEAGPNADAYRAARRGIGMVFQNPEDQLVTTVLEDDVAFGPENLGLERGLISERIVDSLQAVGLANLRQSDPTRMSGGQQQRAAIAGMLAMNPAMLVLDEPTAMLDESARAEVMRILDDLQARGTTIVHVTHHPDETVHADRIVRMEAGRIVGVTAAADNRPPLAEAVSQSETEGGIGTEAAPSRPTNDSPRQRKREDGPELPLLSDGIGDMTNPIIRVSHLTYRYPSAKRAVIDDLSFTIARGETVALMGVNGSGKSTLVRMLCALAAPTAGSIEVAGVPVAATGRRGRNARPKPANRRQLAQLRRHVGYVMQHPEHQLFADTVAEDVAYGPRNQGLAEAEVADRVRESLDLLHIGHLADRSPFDLSGGQQRLAAIAGVLACNPDVLIMDEPTASLDAQAKKRIHELLRMLKSRGVTVLIITHDWEEAEQIADRVVRMPIAGAAGAESISATETAFPAESVSPDKPAHSVIHRLDPRVKMVGFLAAMFTMFAVNTPLQLALGIAITLAVIAAARLNPLRVLESIHPILILLVLMGVVNLFVVRTGTPVVALGPLSITDQGVAIAVLYACRFALVIILGAVFLTTTTPTAMTDAFATLISPLNRLGIHAQEIALVMSLALRFIPTLTDETRAIVDAQSARGGSIETGSLAQRIKAMSAIIVPIFAGTLRHADNLSLALDARCYEESIRRTHWRALTIAAQDLVFAVAVIAYIAAIIAL